ncbi:phosphoribosyltransferase [Flexivirga alba]|uniref:Phosphoribosyltransferase n=1 Tax=Flexivirga alba TaxID=702742 RepID=A0ABW2AGL5_9MICO
MAGWKRRQLYADRAAAGAALAAGLRAYAGRPDVVVLGLPRGGVPVAAAVADWLDVPLDVLVVRKLGLPRHPEVAMGAVGDAAGSVEVVRNPEVLQRAQVTDDEFDRVLATEVAELHRRSDLYRGIRSALPLQGRAVLVVDDGLATGATMRVAVHVIRRQQPARLVVVAPVGPPDVCAALAGEVDELVCPWQPRDFTAVGAAYQVFGQTSNDEVRRLLSAHAR